MTAHNHVLVEFGVVAGIVIVVWVLLASLW